ncbi:hypothetical protein CSC70_04845 [Pseudoxanthomonas kalamensis DSM 18571]|nr:hypothetical protein CSC70_04845 [Pseudoxanthomonas kalamensis DSM 18571]
MQSRTQVCFLATILALLLPVFASAQEKSPAVKPVLKSKPLAGRQISSELKPAPPTQSTSPEDASPAVVHVRTRTDPDFNLAISGLAVPAAKIKNHKIQAFSIGAKVSNRGRMRWGFDDAVLFRLERGRPVARSSSWLSGWLSGVSHSTAVIGRSQSQTPAWESAHVEGAGVSNVAGGLAPGQLVTINAVLEHSRAERISVRTPLGSATLARRQVTQPLNLETNRYYTLIAGIRARDDAGTEDNHLGYVFFVNDAGVVSEGQVFTFDAGGRVVYGNPAWMPRSR